MYPPVIRPRIGGGSMGTRRRVRYLIMGIIVFALAAWGWVWFGVFRRANRLDGSS